MWILVVFRLLFLVSGVVTLRPEEERACWKDDDCRRYPICRTRILACRCQPRGNCLLARGYQQRCKADSHCTIGMICNEEQELCECQEGYRYSKYIKLCTLVPNGDEPPRFADLPNADEEDAGAPHIPPTYSGPILMGTIGMGLVVLCLGTALWCRCTVPRNTSDPDAVCVSPYTECAGEKIPLDLFYPPPPEKYRTPGCHHTYNSINECHIPSTSRNGRASK